MDIVVIGAGSYFFGKPVIYNMVTSPILRSGTLALVDTDSTVLETMVRLAERVRAHVDAPLTIEGAVDLFEDSKMVFKPLNPRLELTAVLAWKRFHSLSGAAAKFLEYFKEYLKNKQ